MGKASYTNLIKRKLIIIKFLEVFTAWVVLKYYPAGQVVETHEVLPAPRAYPGEQAVQVAPTVQVAQWLKQATQV